MIRIKADSLHKKYFQELIFKDLTLDFDQGVSYAITGPNGSGKTTLLKILAGMVPPSRGQIEWTDDNKPIDPDEYYQYLTFMSPYLELIEEFTLQEFLKFHFKMKPKRNGFDVEEFVEFAYLGDSLQKEIYNFSSGMKQRLKLALAFWSESPIVFLDEPGSNLDLMGFDWYLENVKKSFENRLLFIASNQLSEYECCSEQIDMAAFK